MSDETADTITDDKIRALRHELMQRKRPNAYSRSIVKDCTAALEGDPVCRASAAQAWNKLRAENQAWPNAPKRKRGDQ